MSDPAVLVVEDEPTLLRQITTYFDRSGLKARGVDNAAAAEPILSAGQVDVLVTDVMLPGESGLELLRKCDRLSPDTEVIIITGVPNLPSVEEALRGGAFDYLEKPVRLADLKRRVLQATERVRLVREARAHEAEIRRLNAQLARKLESSSAQLSEAREQLAVSSLLAELGRLTSTVCHELANPLTSLLAAAEFLQGQPQAAARDRLAKLIHAGALRCGRITQMLLDVKRVGHSATKPVELAPALAQAKSELQARLDGSRTKLVERLPAGLPPVLGDHELLVGCLVNLVKNALDAMSGHAQARTIEVSARVAGDRVEVQVDDSGPGFPPEALARALEPFFTTKSPDKGTGLGLAIVSATVRSWGGDVRVENRPDGAGARITLDLRASGPLEVGAPPPQERIVALVRGRRVVVCAPAGDVRELLDIALTSWGAQVEIAEGGPALVAACRAATPDAILLDVPGGDAAIAAVYGELHASSPLAAARVIPMVTAAPTPQPFLETFPGPLLNKPFGIQRVAEALEIVLQAQKS